jgi:PhzF family phenazine biosynthesis protein
MLSRPAGFGKKQPLTNNFPIQLNTKEIHSFRCFGKREGGGNPALVIEDESSSPNARQAFARTRNVTCVWIDPSNVPNVIAVVDFFYPHTRSPLCLHATLAVGRRLFALHRAEGELTVETAAGGQRLGLNAGMNDEVFVRLQAQNVVQQVIVPDLLGRLLGAPSLMPLRPPFVASVGSLKLLVEVSNTTTLYDLVPDLPAVVAWGKDIGVNGIYAYCKLKNGSYEGRNFNHLDPASEDSATGVAAGALSSMLGHGITLLQGGASGRSCRILTRIAGPDILIGGNARLA